MTFPAASSPADQRKCGTTVQVAGENLWKRSLQRVASFVVEAARSVQFAVRSRRGVFERIYRRGEWAQETTVSGPGSTMSETDTIRRCLPDLIAELSCQSILDLGCGDFHWLSSVPLDARYIGADVVRDLVAANERAFGSESRRFVCVDAVTDALPRADLVICRDCLVHLSNAGVRRALANIKASGAKYLLTTTFDGSRSNKDIVTGMWRPLNLLASPFSLPEPVRVIDEGCPDPSYPDKRLGLWRTADIPDL